jgi:hypothetical protein
MKRCHVLPAIIAVALFAACHADHRGTRTLGWTGEMSEGSWVRVRDLNGSVHVEPSTTGQVEMLAVVQGRGVQRVQVRGVREGSDLVFCAILSGGGECSSQGYRTRSRSHWMPWRRGNVSVDFTIRVPEGIKVDASTVNGGVHIEEAPSDVIARSVNGRIDASLIAGRVEARTVNGSVRARIGSLPANADVSLSTVNGSVQAELPESASGALDLSTVNGSIRSDFSLAPGMTSTRRQLRGMLGTGGGKLTLKTVNGSVVLAKGA